MSAVAIQFADAVAALYAALSAASGLAGVQVIDGPQPTAQFDGDYVITGHDGSMNPDGSLSDLAAPGSFTLRWAEQDGGDGSGKAEDGSIGCVAVSQGATGDLAARLTRAQELVSACEAACVGLRAGGVVFDGVSAAHVLTRQTGAGCVALIPFTVTYSTLWA